jgi:superfamily I DNA and/or RNA helicase
MNIYRKVITWFLVVVFCFTNVQTSFAVKNSVDKNCLAQNTQIANISNEWQLVSLVLAVYDMYGFSDFGKVTTTEIDSTERIKEALREKLQDKKYKIQINFISNISLGDDGLIYIDYLLNGEEVILRLAPDALQDGFRILSDGEDVINGYKLQVLEKPSESPDSRGWEGLPNEIYTPEIRNALGLDANGDFINDAARNFVCIEYNPDTKRYEVSKLKYDNGLEITGDVKLTSEEMESVNTAISQIDEFYTGFLTQPDEYTKYRAKIIFMPNQSGHYSISRNQYYLGLDLIKNLELLQAKLNHELRERTEIITHHKYSEWKNRRGDIEVEQEIHKIAEKEHKQLEQEELYVRFKVVDNKEAKSLIKEMLQSENPDEIRIYQEQGLVWEDETNSIGLLIFYWTDERGEQQATLCTGKNEHGRVTVRMQWDKVFGCYVFTTMRAIDGRDVSLITTSRFNWNENKKRWCIESFNYNRDRIIKMLQSPDPNNIEAYRAEGLIWEDQTNNDGTVIFSFRDEQGIKGGRLSTGKNGKGPVTVRLQWDTELGYYVFVTERMVEGEKHPIVSTSRFFWNGSKQKWDIQQFDRGLDTNAEECTAKVLEMLQSEDPNRINAYKTDGLTWKDKTNVHGTVIFNWTNKYGYQTVSLTTGTKGKGPVIVKLEWNRELGYYIFTTERSVEGFGKLIVATSRFYWNANKGRWDLEDFNKNKFRIIEMLKSKDPNGIDVYKDVGLTWEDEAESSGAICFRWVNMQELQTAVLTTGKRGKGKVRVRLQWDKELGYYVFTTNRKIKGNSKPIIATARFYWDESKKRWGIKFFERSKVRIIEMLQSDDPNNVDEYKEKELIWQDQTNEHGILNFNWTDKQGRQAAVLTTGKLQEGPVTVRLKWDQLLNCYIFTTERKIGDEIIICHSRFEKNKNGSWRIYQIGTYAVYGNKKLVQHAFRQRKLKGLDNTSWALLYGKKPNKKLYESARKFNVPLEELTVLDREYNQESEIASIKPAGTVAFSQRIREKVLAELRALIAGKKQEKADRSKGINQSILTNQIKHLEDLLTTLEKSDKDIPIPLLELLGLRSVEAITDKELSNIEFANSGIEDDPYQSSMVKLSVLPKAHVVLVQGGPGSGKSTALAETIYQLVKSGKRILLTAHDNSALDNILEKLDKLGLPILRAVSAEDEAELETMVQDNRVSRYIKDYCIKRPARGGVYCPQFSDKGKREFEKRKTKYSGIVLGVTVDSAVINKAVEEFEADVVTIDEAGLCDSVDTILTAARAREKIILVGDHKQLPPYFREEEYIGYPEVYKTYLRESFLARVWDKGYNQVFLARNYRSHPLISHLVGRLFYERLMVPKPWEFMEMEDTIRVVDVPMVNKESNEQIVNLEGGQAFQKKTDYQNLNEAKKCIEEYERALKSGYPASEITIITGYAGQINLIRLMLESYLKINQINLVGYKDLNAYLDEHVLTINQSQGRENGVIILSFVRSNPNPSKVGFMGNLQRLNVALSRARDRLVLIGDMEALRNASATEEDRIFAEKFSHLEDIIHELDVIKADQEELGGFTIHEAIQEVQGVISLKDRCLKSGIGIDAVTLDMMKAYFNNMDDRGFNEIYTLLELFHEMAVIALHKGEEPVYGVTENNYDEFMKKIHIISKKYPEILKIQQSQNGINVSLMWLIDSENQPVVIEVVKEVGISQETEDETLTSPEPDRDEVLIVVRKHLNDNGLLTRSPNLDTKIADLLMSYILGKKVKDAKKDYLSLLQSYEKYNEWVRRIKRLVAELHLEKEKSEDEINKIINAVLGQIYEGAFKLSQLSIFFGATKEITTSISQKGISGEELVDIDREALLIGRFNDLEKYMSEKGKQKKELSSKWSRMSAMLQGLYGKTRLQCAMPVSVLKSAVDLPVALRKMGLFGMKNEKQIIEIIIYDVQSEQEMQDIKTLFKKFTNGSDNVKLYFITKEQMAEKNSSGYPSDLMKKVSVVRDLVQELYPIKENEVATIVTDPVELGSVTEMEKGLAPQIGQNVSIQIVVKSEQDSVILLSSILLNWLDNISSEDIGKISVVLPTLVSPKEFWRQLEELRSTAWGTIATMTSA